MRTLIVVAVLLAGCRGGDHHHASTATSPLPTLPRSRDGAEELRELDHTIVRMRTAHDAKLAEALLARAAITSRLEDYVDALDETARRVAEPTATSAAWRTRALALSRVHEFAAAREALAHVKEPSDELVATIDEATGHAAPYFERAARERPDPRTLTRWAASLAMAGRFDEALAQIPKAAALIHDNSANLISWLLFQWGRIYEQKAEIAAARTFYEEAHRRMPGYLEATVHLAQAMRATGADPSTLIASAQAANRHPALLELDGQLDEARAEWERYVQALPSAFADHAAGFYLGTQTNAPRALELSELNLKIRDTLDARALVVQAALAANETGRACEVAKQLVRGSRAQLFVAWRAQQVCGDRGREAQQIASQLGLGTTAP